MSKKYRNKKWLHQKYVTEGMSDKEISEICSVSDATICRNRNKMGIDAREELTNEQKEKISNSVSEYLEENGHPFEGENHTKEAKEIMSRKKSGENHNYFGEDRPKFSDQMCGSNNPSWKGGVTDDMDFRKSNKWQSFSNQKKDEVEWTCENCSSHGSSVEIHTHHAKPVSSGGDEYDNTFIVLCKDCHKNNYKFWHNSTVEEQLSKIGDT